MELLGSLSEVEWSSFAGIFTSEESNFMEQFLGDNPFSSVEDWVHNLGSSLEPNFKSNSYYFPEESGYSTSNSCSLFLPFSGHESDNLSDSNPIFVNDNSSMCMDVCMVDGLGDSGEAPQLKRKSEIAQPNTNKKFQVSENIETNETNVQPKKIRKIVPISNDGEGTNTYLNGHSSDIDTNASQELIGGEETLRLKGSTAIDLNEKTRSKKRGLATNPQSLYARRRRERINERLKILQNLIPNGTKVDISTMLEEAVQYVKFLQVQIKLLSSDDLWMYAPIAYNGMNIDGLDLEAYLPR